VLNHPEKAILPLKLIDHLFTAVTRFFCSVNSKVGNRFMSKVKQLPVFNRLIYKDRDKIT